MICILGYTNIICTLLAYYYAADTLLNWASFWTVDNGDEHLCWAEAPLRETSDCYCCLCNHAPIEGILSSRAFHRNLWDAERERWRKREIKDERERESAEGREVLLQPEALVNKHVADEERRCWKCVRRSEQQHEQELLVELGYCACSLCNLSATLLRPLLCSNVHVINIITEA